MAREKNVTRTFKVMHATVLIADANTRAVTETVVDLPRVYKNEKELIKAIKNIVETDTIKFVSVGETTVEEKMYAMSEIDFIKHAKEVPTRNSK